MKKITIFIILFFIIFWLGIILGVNFKAKPDIGHPILWFNKSQLKELKRNIQKYDWMSNLFQGIKKEADLFLKDKVDVPEDGGVIREEIFPGGKKIIQLSPTEYYSESEDKVYQGETVIRGKGSVVLKNFPYKQFFDNDKHHRLAHQAKVLAFTYAITGEKKYAERVKEILVSYALNFSQNKYPIHKYDGSIYEPDPVAILGYGGRVTITALEESAWVYQMMCAYDWTYDSSLYSKKEKDLIEEMFLIEYRTISTTLNWNNSYRYLDNHTTYQNLARMTYGILKKDSNIIAEAAYGKMGFTDHLDSVMTSEGKTEAYGIGYHFFFLCSLVYTAEIHNRAGYGNLFSYQDKKLKKGIDFIINSTYLDGLRIPQVETASQEWSWTSAFQSLFESAYNRYREPSYLIPILDDLKFLYQPGQEEFLQAYLKKWGEISSKRGTYTQAGGPHYIEALISGYPRDIVKKPIISLPSVHFNESKYLFLRKGDSERGIGVFINYDEKGHHSDVASFQFFALGQELGRESGMAQSYETKDYGAWYSQRVAHNTVVVDQSSPGLPPNYGSVGPQLSSMGTAQVTLFDPNPENPRAILSANGTIYPEVEMTRDISIKEGTINIVDTLISSSIHIYDWVYRNVGQVINISGVNLAPWEGELGQDYGYQKEYIFNIRRGKTNSNFKITWLAPANPSNNKEIAVDLEVQACPDTEVILADAYWEKRQSIGPILLIRRNRKETQYKVSLKPYEYNLVEK